MKQLGAFFVPVITLLMAQVVAVDLGWLRFHGKKLWLLLGLGLIIQVLLNAPIILFFGLQAYAKFYVLTMDLPAILLFFYLSQRRDFSTLYTIFCTIFSGFAISFAAIWVINIFDGSYPLYNLVRIILFMLSMPILHYYFREKYQLIQREMQKGWGMFCILPMICVSAIYYQYSHYGFYNNNYRAMSYSSAMILIMMIIFITFFYVFQEFDERYQLQEQQRILALQNKAQWEMFQYHKEASELTNRRWHDHRFQTNNLIELVEKGDIDLALKYLREQQMYDLPVSMEYCKHTFVNSILLLWAERARKVGISIDIKTEIPQSINIDPMELSALFANAIENAYYGCERLSDDHFKFIYIEANYLDGCLSIKITNSCQSNIPFQDQLPVSSKEGGGSGIRSILYIAKMHKGTALFDARDNQFTLQAVLYV